MKRVMYLVVFVVAASLLLTAVVSPVGAGRLAQNGTGTGTPDANGTGIPQTGNQNAGGPAFLNLQTLQSFQVQDITGNALGSVGDFVINLGKTRIDYLVMNGNNGRQVLVPWSSLSAIDAQSRTFTFKDPGSRLENAPAFDANGLDFSDPSWSQSTINYWRFGVGVVNNSSDNSGQGQSATAQSGSSSSSSTSGDQSQSGTAQPTGQAQNGQSGAASGQNSGNGSQRSGAVAVLASRLMNAQVIDLANTSFGSGNNQSNNNQQNNSSNNSSGNSGSAQTTPMATDQGGQSTSVPNTGSDASNNQAGNANNGQFNSSDVLGTVAGAIVTRLNGDIRFILVQPQGALAESIRQASLNAQNQNNQGTSVPNTGSGQSNNPSNNAQSGTAQPTDMSNSSSGNGGSGSTSQSTAQATGIPQTGSNAQVDGNGVIPVPFDIMFPTVQNGNLVLRASPFMLRSAPVVQSNIDNLGFGWDQNINQFWGSGGLQGGRFPLFSGDNGLQAGTNGGVPVTGSDQASLASSAFVQLNTLQNFAIQDGSGNSLGSIQDFVVNVPKTRIDYVVVSGTDGRQVLVPWAALSSVDTNSKAFFFRYAGNTLQNAPAFDVNTLNFNDPEWDNDTINFWITGRNASANNSNNSGSNAGNTSGSANNSNAQSTPDANSQGTSVPNTGNNGQTGNAQAGNNGQSQGGPVGAVAVLASQLVGAPVYDVTAVNATGGQIGGNSGNQGNNTGNQGGNTGNSGSDNSGSAGNGSGQTQGTTVATGTAGDGSTGNVQSTGVPNTGGLQGNTGSDVIGTVRGAIVTRINGDIRYLLVEPAAGIANTGGSGQSNGQQAGTAQPGANNSSQNNSQGSSGNGQNSAQTSGTPQAGNNSQNATAQPTGIPNTGNTGTGGFLVAVPFNAVTTSASNGQLFLRVSPFMLRNAPSLDLSSLPEVLGFGFDQGILNFWNSGQVGGSSSNQGNDSGSATQTP